MKEIDWEQRRYEIAKEMFVTMYDMAICTIRDLAKTSVRCANTLIEELKKTSK